MIIKRIQCCRNKENTITNINMSEGFHRGGTWDCQIATLPINWRARQGLKYPLEINLADGEKKTFNNYAEHHEFIKSLFNIKNLL